MKKKVILGLLAVFVIAGAVGAFSSGNKKGETTAAPPVSGQASVTTTTAGAPDQTTPKPATTAAPKTTATPTTTAAPTTTAEPTTTAPAKEAYQVGDTLTNKDLTLVYVSSGEYESDNQFMQPGDGKKYIFLEFYVEYNGKDSTSVSYFDFDGYADGYAVDQKYGFEDNLSGSISAGRWNMGKLYFEVPVDAKEIEVEYELDLFSKKTWKFLYEGVKDSGFVPEAKKEASSGAIQPGEETSTKNMKITYLGCGETKSDNQFIQPEEGNIFIYFELELENIGSSEQSVNSLYFHCYADGKVCGSHSMVREDDLDAKLTAGRKAKGSVVFEVPANAEVVELEYETSLIMGDKVIFSYVK